MKYELSLPYLRAFLGVIFIALSLAATVAFLGQGFSGLTFITIVCFVLGIECVKVLFAGDISYYLALKQPEKALFSFAIVLILYVLTVIAETWYLSNGNLNQAAKLESISARSGGLQQQITAKQAQLSSCNPSHLTKCVNPRTAELQALQSEFDKIQAAELSQSELMANAKFWQQIATATGASVENLQLGLNVLRSALAEIIGLFLFAQFSTYKRLQSLSQSDLNAVYTHETPATHTIAPAENNAALIENMKLLKQIQDLKAEIEKKQ
jgi:hypothetical protein